MFFEYSFSRFYSKKKESQTIRFKFKYPYKPSNNPYRRFSLKVGDFKGRSINGNVKKKTPEANFSRKDVFEKIGEKPRCYLTGDIIDLNKSETYSFDHIIPKARGGDNSLKNLNITTIEVNYAKRYIMVEEFFNLCKKVLRHNGYTVIKSQQTNERPNTCN